MNIQQRITFLFTAVCAGILGIFMLVVYLSASKNRANEFYNILEKEAITKVNLLIETQLDSFTLQTIYRNNRKILYEVETAIYDDQYNLIYHDAVDIDFVKETPEMLSEILDAKRIQFTQEDWQVIGIVHHSKGMDYLVTAAAFDGYGFSKLNNLRSTMMITFIIGLVVIFMTGKYFSKNSLLPLSKMSEEARKISASNLDLRLKEGNDEIGTMAKTFNAMLERLEKSFESQKQFVSYLAHEFRTPLAIIIGEVELSLSKPRQAEDYQQTLETVLKDSKKIAQLSESFLDLAKASYDKAEVNFQKVRLDECLIEASQKLQRNHANYRVELDLDESIDEGTITINGNSYLLSTAFRNLLENACKYSENNSCKVHITSIDKKCHISFSDQGVGISIDELDDIFKPFFRGSSRELSEGSGIGLYLVEKIIQLHEGKIFVDSEVGKGSTFTVIL
ncbi:HAMP domain-containing sensor histidine kinase [Belliella pelovolcani]|uniref:histidine kinase n=1 Tax=Belliella pelovolcani TaxID=529505 RepID=A0A1N7JZD8_9BACT|nr:HAMP domain-containing sensor histidine kinase [Belliella pelovolcani]SIS54626.1 Signal transduction histidine kinase [Belliella pelovolcani]